MRIASHAGTAVALLALLAATGALAKDTAISGSILYKYIDRGAVTAGDEGTIRRFELEQVVPVAAGPAANAMDEIQRCGGSILVGKDGKPKTGHGYCDTINTKEGVWWLTWSAGETESTWTIVGGTGKFKGISGTGKTTYEPTLDGVETTGWKQEFVGTVTMPDVPPKR
jgi:hypothetical protein